MTTVCTTYCISSPFAVWICQALIKPPFPPPCAPNLHALSGVSKPSVMQVGLWSTPLVCHRQSPPQGPHPALIRTRRKKTYASSSLITLFFFIFLFVVAAAVLFISGLQNCSSFISFFFFANKRWALYCREILTSSRFCTGLHVMVALLKGLEINTKSLGGEEKENKNNLFLILKTCWGLPSCHSVIVNITFIGSNWKSEVQIDLFLL